VSEKIFRQLILDQQDNCYEDGELENHAVDAFLGDGDWTPQLSSKSERS